MKKFTGLMVFHILLISAGLSAQSNELLDSFLEKEKADIATSFLLIAQASGQLPLESSPQEGYQWAVQQRFGRKVSKKDPQDPVPLGLFYWGVLESFDIKGGIFYGIFRGPRYAVLEAGYRQYVEPGEVYVNRKMSPVEVLSGLSLVVEELK